MASNALAVLVWVGALVAMLAFVLLQGWRERAAQRERQRQAAAAATPVAAMPKPLTGSEAWGRVVEEAAVPVVVAVSPRLRPAPAPVLPARRRGRRFRTRAELRRAVIASTVLGPCRAQAPWRDPGDEAEAARR